MFDSEFKFAFDSVLLLQLSGMFLGLWFVVGWAQFFRKFLGPRWPFGYLGFLLTFSALLTMQAVFVLPGLKELAALVCCLLALYGTASLFLSNNFLRQGLRDVSRFKLVTLKQNWNLFFFAALFLIEMLFAAFPGYRYDQWNYHLTIPKMIDRYTVLPPLFGSDHTHFSGSWEYFFSWMRVVLTNDWLVQTTTTTISFLSYVLPSAGLLSLLANSAPAPKRELKLLLIFGMLCVYAHSEHEPIVSAKPDFVLLSCALAIVAAQTLGIRARLFVSAFFAIASASFKLTWLHSAAALGVGVAVVNLICKREELLSCLRTRKVFVRNLAMPALTGLFLGALCFFPYLYKNYIVFENPLHPTQAFGFVSNTSTPEFLRYWKDIAGRPSSFAQSLQNVLDSFARAATLFAPLFFPVALIFWLRPRAQKQRTVWWPWGLAWLFYVLLWAFLLQANTFSRFVATLAVFPLTFIAMHFRNLKNSGFEVLVVLVPCLIVGGIEVKLKKMARALTQNTFEFTKTAFGPELQDFRESKLIDDDSAARGASANCTILATKFGTYAFNRRLMWQSDHAAHFFMRSFGLDKLKACPFAFLVSLNPCYIIEHGDTHLQIWPFSKLSELKLVRVGHTPEFEDLNVHYIGKELEFAAAAERESTPICRE